MTDMKTKFFNVVLASLVIAAPALAADPSTTDGAKPKFTKNLDGGPGGECQRGSRGSHKAKFSDEQLEKMSSLKNQFLDSTASKRTELESLSRQMKEVFKAESIDRSKAIELESKIASLKADLSKSRLNLKLDTIALLTPEQKQEMRHRMLRGGFGGGHHRGGHRQFGHGGPGNHGGGGHFKIAAPQEKA